MDVRTAYQEKVEAQIERFNAEFQKLEAEARKRKAVVKEARADAALNFDNHVSSLNQRQKELRNKFHNMKEASAESWEEMKVGIDRAIKELEESFEKAKELMQCAVK